MQKPGLFPYILAFILLIAPPAARRPHPARLIPMTFVVTTTDDVVDAGVGPGYLGPPWCPDDYPNPVGGQIYPRAALDPAALPGPDGEVSLREAICAANGNPGPDLIAFNLPGTGPFTIALSLGNLPTLLDGGTTLDATGQPGYGGSPLVFITEGSGGLGDAGLILRSADNVVRGVAIGNFDNYGILIDEAGATDNLIELDYLGVAPDGSTPAGMGLGVYLQNGDTNTIQNNLISANGTGVFAATGNNTIQDNRIGTDAGGGSALGNSMDGVAIVGEASAPINGNQILDNVISGNAGHGVYLIHATNVTIQGNLIGSDSGGSSALPNGFGLHITYDSSNNMIGGANPGEGNLISGNDSGGMDLSVSTANNQVVGNFIGTTLGGGGALGNGGDGLRLWFGTSGNTISGNVISGNSGHGVAITLDAADNLLTGNMIGTDAGGVFSIPNGFDGVSIGNGAANITIGGPGAGEGNVISGNSLNGIDISTGNAYPVSGIIIQGNKIGTNLAGTNALGNGYEGINGGAQDLTIGGASVAEGNLISGNGGHGILLDTGVAVTGIQIANNLIGTDIGGNSAIANAGHGVWVKVDDVLVQENTIAHNQAAGVVVDEPNLHVTITRNSMFNNSDLGIDLIAPYGWTPNDSGDPDSGANTLLNYPEFTSVTATSAEGTACSGCLVELFLDDNDPLGYGEGKTFLADQVAAGGNFSFDLSALGAELQACEKLTATATDGAGNTSEFTPSQGTGSVGCITVNPVILIIVVVLTGGVFGGLVYTRRKKPTWGVGGFIFGGILGGFVYFVFSSYLTPRPPLNLSPPTPRYTFPAPNEPRETETPIRPPTEVTNPDQPASDVPELNPPSSDDLTTTPTPTKKPDTPPTNTNAAPTETKKVEATNTPEKPTETKAKPTETKNG